jgi:hypothetical protein
LPIVEARAVAAALRKAETFAAAVPLALSCATVQFAETLLESIAAALAAPSTRSGEGAAALGPGTPFGPDVDAAVLAAVATAGEEVEGDWPEQPAHKPISAKV